VRPRHVEYFCAPLLDCLVYEGLKDRYSALPVLQRVIAEEVAEEVWFPLLLLVVNKVTYRHRSQERFSYPGRPIAPKESAILAEPILEGVGFDEPRSGARTRHRPRLRDVPVRGQFRKELSPFLREGQGLDRSVRLRRSCEDD